MVYKLSLTQDGLDFGAQVYVFDDKDEMLDFAETAYMHGNKVTATIEFVPEEKED